MASHGRFFNRLIFQWTLASEADRLGLKAVVGFIGFALLYIFAYIFGSGFVQVLRFATITLSLLCLLYISVTLIRSLIRYFS